MPEWNEILVILLVAVVVFGPHRLPAMARRAGKMVAEFRMAARELREGLEKELALEDMREAAQDVVTPTKAAAQELRKSLAGSERALRSSPPLAHPSDTKPGGERTGGETPDNETTDTTPAETKGPPPTNSQPAIGAETQTGSGPVSPSDTPTAPPHE